MSDLIKAFVLGLVEGVTEFIPVSSTGHLILAAELLGFEGAFATTFEIVIQLGAILAVVWLYRAKLFGSLAAATRDPVARQLVINIAIAFVPAAAVGFLIHDWIKAYLFGPVTVAAALVIGGLAILAIERWKPAPVVAAVDDMPARKALGVGIAQILSLVPGVSRSGATIMGGLCIGLSRTAATEFSFFVSVPIMIAATTFELVDSRDLLSADQLPAMIVGFVTSFISALIVVKAFLQFVSRNSFAAFAWYRIVFGALLLFWFLR